MSHRVNIMIDDSVWEELQTIPLGERSRLINEAVAETLLKRRRLAAIERMDELRKTVKPVPGTSEEWVRADRESH